MKVKEYIVHEEQNTPLQERLKLVRKLFHLAMKINEQGKYYVFFDLYPHASGIEIRVSPVEDYREKLNISKTYYDCEFKTDEEMFNNLKEVFITLSRYLEVKNG